MKQILLLFLGLAFLSPSYAEGWFVDVGRGSAGAEHSESELEGSDQYTRASLGYAYPDDVSIEAGMLDLGEATDGLIAAETDGVYGAIKGTLRGKPADFYMRVGLYKWKGEVCSMIGCDSEDGLDVLIGGGFSFDLGPGNLNVELHFVDLDDEVAVTMSGFSYSILFGR